jgi:hypothetical protein
MPSHGLFAGKRWLASPRPFQLTPEQVRWLERLGHWLAKFQAAANVAYFRSLEGKLPAWIATLLDAGKPSALLQQLRGRGRRYETPRVLRPDLLFTEDGSFQLTELDSVPGGIGLTAWLAETYAKAAPEAEIVGGVHGMLTGFRSLFSPEGADILISAEAGDYLPEMQWMAEKLPKMEVHAAETYAPRGRDMYRFFEMFDHQSISHLQALQEAAEAGKLRLEAPMKPWLEEKLWLALLWSRPLQDFWRQELRESHFTELKKLVPESWVLDPTPLPPHGVIPGLDIQDWGALRHFTQKQRQLVAKVSGFSERAWGSRGVTVGHDVSQPDFHAAIQQHLSEFEHQPAILQRFIRTGLVEHPYFDPQTGQERQLVGRVRLCPYYFKAAESSRTQLGGVLATIVPADKKVIHGMEDAILVPCSLAKES